MKSEHDSLPELSHLQFAALEIMGTSEMSGKELRAGLLTRFGIKKSGPAFYQAMARLEDAKYAEGWYSQEIIDGQIIKERRYKITPAGVRVLNQTKAFYHGRTRPVTFRPAYA